MQKWDMSSSNIPLKASPQINSMKRQVIVRIRVHYYGAFAKMNASFFSFLPAQREKSCVTGLYFLPQNKKVNTDETAATHRTFLSLLLLVFFTSKCI